MTSISSTPSSFLISIRLDPREMTSQWKSKYIENQKTSSTLNRFTEFCSTYLNPGAWFLPPEPPLKLGQLKPSQIPLNQELVVLGDIHGEILGLIENLLNAGLIDSEGNWAQKESIFVQLGDVIDRGYASEAAWNYLAKLQAQAEEGKGEVVRLIGNHELMVLEGFYHLANRVIIDPPQFALKVKEEIKLGKVKLAYTDGKRLFVHAGLRSKMRDLLIKELMEKKGCSPQELYLGDLVDYLNELLVRGVESEDFSHPIFDVGTSRGGDKSVGGILWEDISEILKSKGALDVAQVIGHNPPRYMEDPMIRITESQKLLAVDAGLNPVYGGNRAYVIFNPSEIKIRAKNQTMGQWIELIAKDHLLQSEKEFSQENSKLPE